MEWTVTDPDCNQRYKQISKDVFQFQEDRIFDPVTKETYREEQLIDLKDYTLDEIVSDCAAFGYTSKEVCAWYFNGENYALIAECIFKLA